MSYIENECIISPWSRRMIEDELALDHTLYLIAQDDALRPLGFIGASVMIDTADITNVAVLNSSRRHGIGRALVMTLLNKLSQIGVKEVLLEVRTKNESAIELYRVCGFNKIAVRRNYYKNPHDDAIIMRRDI